MVAQLGDPVGGDPLRVAGFELHSGRVELSRNRRKHLESNLCNKLTSSWLSAE